MRNKITINITNKSREIGPFPSGYLMIVLGFGICDYQPITRCANIQQLKIRAPRICNHAAVI